MHDVECIMEVLHLYWEPVQSGMPWVSLPSTLINIDTELRKSIWFVWDPSVMEGTVTKETKKKKHQKRWKRGLSQERNQEQDHGS